MIIYRCKASVKRTNHSISLELCLVSKKEFYVLFDWYNLSSTGFSILQIKLENLFQKTSNVALTKIEQGAL